MSLHLILGFDSQHADAKPSVVYLGKDGDAAQAAVAKSKAARFEIFRNPAGVRKVNPNYTPPKAK